MQPISFDHRISNLERWKGPRLVFESWDGDRHLNGLKGNASMAEMHVLFFPQKVFLFAPENVGTKRPWRTSHRFRGKKTVLKPLATGDTTIGWNLRRVYRPRCCRRVGFAMLRGLSESQ